VSAPTDGVIVLRDPREDDVPALVEGCRDPLTRRYTAHIPDPYEPEDARAFLALAAELWAKRKERHFAIAAAETGELLGMAGVHHVDRDARTAMCGYWVGPRHRGRGIATRALRLLVAWAAEELGVERFALHADVANSASHAVAERAGFERRPDVLRERIGGAERDALRFELAVSGRFV
jgi:RimJ/RimL family protein N-acetyltransferase